MAQFSVLLIVYVFMTMTLTVFSYEEENRDDWIDPNDMLNFDPSTNTMRKDKLKFEDMKSRAASSSSPDPVDGINDIPDDMSVDSSEEQVACPSCKPCEDLVDRSCPPCDKVDKDCPPCPKVDVQEKTCPASSTCPPCQCDAPQECSFKRAPLPLLRKYVKSILNHIGNQRPTEGKEDFTFHISLSLDDVIVLEKFSDVGNVKHVHDVHDILGNMINHIASSRTSKMEKVALWLEHKIGLKLDRLIQFMMLAALASIVLLIEIRLQIAWRRRVVQLIVLMFVISIPWTWYDLYKQAEIKQHSTVIKKVPKECEDSESWITSLKSFIFLKEDKCHEYHEHMMIDPLIKVPPTKAIAVTVVRFWVAPLKDIGTGLSEFIRALLVDLPLTLYPVAIGVVALILFMFLFMWFGYSIRLPFFLTIEPGPRYAVADGQIQQAIQDTSKNTRDQLERITSLMEETEKQIADRLMRMEKQQQVAIEYNMSMDHGGPVTPPSLSPQKVNSKKNESSGRSVPSLSVTDISAASHPSSENTVQLDRGDPDNSKCSEIDMKNKHDGKVKTDGTAHE